jgi:hypothetical protein
MKPLLILALIFCGALPVATRTQTQAIPQAQAAKRSEEHTSELQSLDSKN